MKLSTLWFADYAAELLKIKTYRAPRDKVICVLNCCKVIFGIVYILWIWALPVNRI